MEDVEKWADPKHVIRTEYRTMSNTSDYWPGEQYTRQVTELTWADAKGARRAVTEDDGIILTVEYRQRGVTQRAFGREVGAEEAAAIQAETRRSIPEMMAWDGYLIKAEQTDGPEQKAELLESFEAKKKRERKEKDMQETAISHLARSLDKITKVESPTTASPDELIAELKKQLNPAQLEEMLLETLEPSGKGK